MSPHRIGDMVRQVLVLGGGPAALCMAASLAEQGPLCTRFVWRGRCGRSALRLDVQLRAACPWLELQLQVNWRQRHELLRLEIPWLR